MRAVVRHPVPLFGREVPAPVADFDVSLQEGGVDERFREFVPHRCFLLCACGDVVVGPVGEG